MMLLLIFKLFVPLIFVNNFFVLFLKNSKIQFFDIFKLIIVFIDIMTLNFFLLVSDHGSWLEIGNSISRFIIMSFKMLLLLFLYFISNLF
jgi:GPI ethanolamine phosphate transferase 1